MQVVDARTNEQCMGVLMHVGVSNSAMRMHCLNKAEVFVSIMILFEMGRIIEQSCYSYYLWAQKV